MLQLTAIAALALAAPPPKTDKAGTARWMAHNINWGVMASKSVHLGGGKPFGNANSYLGEADGNLYFYVTSMDTTMQDVLVDPHVSFTVSEAGMAGMCSVAGAKAGTALPDPEDPTCARLTFSGTMERLDNATAKAIAPRMFARHPQMKAWPVGHGWEFWQLKISDVWLIDFYGGAAIVSPADYFAAPPPKESPAPTYAALADEDFKMGPPPGPNNTGLCPVTGSRVLFDSQPPPPSVEFKHGQRLYFASAQAAAAYRAAPLDYFLAPHDKPLPPPDGMRGLPDLRGEHLTCPRSGEDVHVGMATPRVMHRHGQAVYFCCFGCVSAFWTDPAAYFA